MNEFNVNVFDGINNFSLFQLAKHQIKQKAFVERAAVWQLRVTSSHSLQGQLTILRGLHDFVQTPLSAAPQVVLADSITFASSKIPLYYTINFT